MNSTWHILRTLPFILTPPLQPLTFVFSLWDQVSLLRVRSTWSCFLVNFVHSSEHWTQQTAPTFHWGKGGISHHDYMKVCSTSLDFINVSTVSFVVYNTKHMYNWLVRWFLPRGVRGSETVQDCSVPPGLGESPQVSQGPSVCWWDSWNRQNTFMLTSYYVYRYRTIQRHRNESKLKH